MSTLFLNASPNKDGNTVALAHALLGSEPYDELGSPMYWHNITGLLRNFLDRCYGPVQPGDLAGKRLFFLFQGAAPEKWQLEARKLGEQL